MRTLYEIGSDLSEIEQMLTDTEGEIPEGEIGAAIEKWFDSLTNERDEKVRRMCGLIEMMKFNAEACDEEARRLGRLKRANENGAERLKERLKEFFQAHNIKKLDLKIFKPHIRTNGGQVPLIYPKEWETVPANAPERFHRPVILLNTESMRVEAEQAASELSALEARATNGDIPMEQYERELAEIDSAFPDVRLGERGCHLRLR
jgi:hypothetical protein